MEARRGSKNGKGRTTTQRNVNSRTQTGKRKCSDTKKGRDYRKRGLCCRVWLRSHGEIRSLERYSTDQQKPPGGRVASEFATPNAFGLRSAVRFPQCSIMKNGSERSEIFTAISARKSVRGDSGNTSENHPSARLCTVGCVQGRGHPEQMNEIFHCG